jgi:hypothetical protein
VNGDEPRSFVHGFDAVQVDMAVPRDFSIIESVKRQLRAEAFKC